MPSTGKATTRSPADVTMIGRPDLNSARPRSTATCLGVPNKPDVPLPAILYTHVFGSRRPQNRTDRRRTRPGAFYSVGGRLFRCARLQSPSREISWHDATGSESRYLTMAHGRPPRPNRSERGGRENGSDAALSWAPVPKTFRAGDGSLPQPWEDIFGPLRKGAIDDLVLVGQCGQSIDARVATPTGHSHYINSEAGLAHLHRLRALVDAVVIGVGTAIADDPQLTVRRVEGPNPARIVVDPNGRLPS